MSRKGENIYKRKDGRWEARYIKEHRINGRIHYGYCYGKTYHEARDKVNQARYALMNDQLLPVRKNISGLISGSIFQRLFQKYL